MAKIFLSPNNSDVLVNGNITLDIHEDSGSTLINAVQTEFSYDPAQFKFVSFSAAKSAFGLAVTSNGTDGRIEVVRGITPGMKGVSGDKIVISVTLKALATGGASVVPASGSKVVTSAGNADILAGITGGRYQVK